MELPQLESTIHMSEGVLGTLIAYSSGRTPASLFLDIENGGAIFRFHCQGKNILTYGPNAYMLSQADYIRVVRTSPPELPFEVLVEAVEFAITREHVSTVPGIAIAWDNRWRFYNSNAWELPANTPFLPWSPPDGVPCYVAFADGSYEVYHK